MSYNFYNNILFFRFLEQLCGSNQVKYEYLPPSNNKHNKHKFVWTRVWDVVLLSMFAIWKYTWTPKLSLYISRILITKFQGLISPFNAKRKILFSCQYFKSKRNFCRKNYLVFQNSFRFCQHLIQIIYHCAIILYVL